jgi:hypothetical protein
LAGKQAVLADRHWNEETGWQTIENHRQIEGWADRHFFTCGKETDGDEYFLTNIIIINN